MSRLSFVPAVALCLIAAPFAAAAGDASSTQTAQPQGSQPPPQTETSGRRISEEGGMKASGPSQAKDGESR